MTKIKDFMAKQKEKLKKVDPDLAIAVACCVGGAVVSACASYLVGYSNGSSDKAKWCTAITNRANDIMVSKGYVTEAQIVESLKQVATEVVFTEIMKK